MHKCITPKKIELLGFKNNEYFLFSIIFRGLKNNI